jgi:hypothetical protein
MPVTPCFDPTTGASGGVPPAASASLYNVPRTVVDLTDGTWTLYDPDSLIDTTYGTNGVTFSGGFNTIQWNALAVGSLNYNWAASGEHRAPRWYKAFEIDGNAVETGPMSVLHTVMEHDPAFTAFDQQIVMAAATDAASVDIFAVAGSGGYFHRVGTANPVYGVWTFTSQTSTPSATSVRAHATTLRGGAFINGGTFIGVDGSGARTVNGSRTVSIASSVGSVPQGLMVGFGVMNNTATIPAGAQQRVALSYVAFTPAP